MRISPPLSSLPLPLDVKIAEMYAAAALHYPKNQEILTHLFMAYVRLGDYQRQQHTAIQLHKAFPESGPYYCWRVMSILMQVYDVILYLSRGTFCGVKSDSMLFVYT